MANLTGQALRIFEFRGPLDVHVDAELVKFGWGRPGWAPRSDQSDLARVMEVDEPELLQLLSMEVDLSAQPIAVAANGLGQPHPALTTRLHHPALPPIS